MLFVIKVFSTVLCVISACKQKVQFKPPQPLKILQPPSLTSDSSKEASNSPSANFINFQKTLDKMEQSLLLANHKNTRSNFDFYEHNANYYDESDESYYDNYSEYEDYSEYKDIKDIAYDDKNEDDNNIIPWGKTIETVHAKKLVSLNQIVTKDGDVIKEHVFDLDGKLLKYFRVVVYGKRQLSQEDLQKKIINL